MNVTAELLVIHLQRLLYLFLEVGGWLGNGTEGRNIERAILLDGAFGKRPFPALFAHPAIHFLFPVGVIGKDSVDQLKGCGIELKYREIAKLVSVRVKELIIVDG